jgi:hypothetical protein
MPPWEPISRVETTSRPRFQMVVIDEHLQQLGDCREFDA